jgi:nitroreductase
MEETKKINGFKHLRYTAPSYPTAIMEQKSIEFYESMNQRRTVRDLSSEPVDKSIIDRLIQTASTAPSGAHKQPWTFCAISSASIKKEIRKAAEAEEKESYDHRMSDRWLNDLKPMATDWHKPFLENAPWLIVIFKQAYELGHKEKQNNYYVNESVGIACGLLITAIHQVGLATLTHTPSPMAFLTKILNRPENERPFLLLPVGYAAEHAYVPDLKRKPLEDVAVYY